MSDWNLDPLVQRLKKRGVLEQRAHIPSKRKPQPDKPWRVCWRWQRARDGALLNYDSKRHSRCFATEDQARRFMAKEQRSFSCHPATGRRWGPVDHWVEGPNTQPSSRPLRPNHPDPVSG